jgi:N-acetylmuramoyl-L-alanine amidase
MRRLALLILLLLVTTLAHGQAPDSSRAARESRTSDWRTLVGGPGPENAQLHLIDGVAYIGANDFARLIDATKFWHGSPRKLVLRVTQHRLQFTVDNPFVLVDDHTVLLDQPVRSVGGEPQIPADFAKLLPDDPDLPRLVIDSEGSRVFRVPPSGIVGSPKVSVEGGVTRIVFPVDRPDEVVVAARSRAHFRIRFSGFFAGAIPRTLPEGVLLDTLRTLRTASGTAFELRIAPSAAGFRLESDTDRSRVTLALFPRAAGDLERFAPAPPAGRRLIRTIVLDPGHGGSDRGVQAEGLAEKDLTLALARQLQQELQRRLRARVVLTRTEDQTLSAAERAERANRARADLVISLHMDGFSGARARGVTVYCPPATVGSGDEDGAEAIVLLPWRDVALRHAVLAREVAEDVQSALELHSLGPTRLREMMMVPMLGVNAPGIMLECATLTAEADRKRLGSVDGVRVLAATIADGVAAYEQGIP